jgi:hypothetical protein
MNMSSPSPRDRLSSSDFTLEVDPHPTTPIVHPSGPCISFLPPVKLEHAATTPVQVPSSVNTRRSRPNSTYSGQRRPSSYSNLELPILIPRTQSFFSMSSLQNRKKNHAQKYRRSGTRDSPSSPWTQQSMASSLDTSSSIQALDEEDDDVIGEDAEDNDLVLVDPDSKTRNLEYRSYRKRQLERARLAGLRRQVHLFLQEPDTLMVCTR